MGPPLTARQRSNPLQLPAFLGRHDVKSTRLMAVMVAVYAVIMSYVVLLRYYSFQTHAFDLGIFSQAFSTALQGRLFYETPDQLLIPSGSSRRPLQPADVPVAASVRRLPIPTDAPAPPDPRSGARRRAHLPRGPQDRG